MEFASTRPDLGIGGGSSGNGGSGASIGFWGGEGIGRRGGGGGSSGNVDCGLASVATITGGGVCVCTGTNDGPTGGTTGAFTGFGGLETRSKTFVGGSASAACGAAAGIGVVCVTSVETGLASARLLPRRQSPAQTAKPHAPRAKAQIIVRQYFKGILPFETSIRSGFREPAYPGVRLARRSLRCLRQPNRPLTDPHSGSSWPIWETEADDDRLRLDDARSRIG